MNSKNVLGDTYPKNLYYAYGIRNGFGMDFDPVTGTLWDTENGPSFGDEINLVQPGFNSGWVKIQGFAKDQLAGKIDPAKDLVNVGGKGVYTDPKFVWNQPVAPTALKFLNSDKLGKQYQNTMFVGDVLTGNLYNFKLNPERTGLWFNEDGKPLYGKWHNSMFIHKGDRAMRSAYETRDRRLYLRTRRSVAVALLPAARHGPHLLRERAGDRRTLHHVCAQGATRR